MAGFLMQAADPVAHRIREAAARGVLPHALLFTGGGNRIAAARYAAAALQCEHGEMRPCGYCRACHKVAGDIHPDVITVRDEAHKNVAVEVVRSVRADAWIRPNEGRRKVYLFPDCAVLTEQDQNVLLKLVEEGPAYAAFLFCAENAGQMLQTLRSRCVEWKLGETEAANSSSAAAKALCHAIGERRRGAAAVLAAQLEKTRMDRASLVLLLEESRQLFAEALLLLHGRKPEEESQEIASFLAKNLTKDQIMSTIELLETYTGECVYNVGPGHVLGALAAELEGIL